MALIKQCHIISSQTYSIGVILDTSTKGTSIVTERTAHQALATGAELEYETRQAWEKTLAKPATQPVRKPLTFWQKVRKFFKG